MIYTFDFLVDRRITVFCETKRINLYLNILLRIIKFWIHLESLPAENSIAKQCLIISNQLANEAKTSFMLTVNEIIHNYKDIHHQSYNKTIQTNNIPTIKNNLQKIKCHISNNLKRHQLELIRCNRKLCFYSLFKIDVSKSHYLEQIKNLKHRRAVAKLRSGNHNLRIESGQHCVPKSPECLRIVNTVTLTKLRTKIISYFIVIAIKLLDNK